MEFVSVNNAPRMSRSYVLISLNNKRKTPFVCCVLQLLCRPCREVENAVYTEVMQVVDKE